MELHTLSHSTSETSSTALALTFTINHIQLVKSVRVDVLEQDDDFVTLQTLNYTITEDTYKDGSVCLTGLTPGVQYLVCLRVDYHDIGKDSTCSHLVRERKDTGQESVVGALLLVALLFCFLGLYCACESSQSKNGSTSSINTER